ncbi:MAG: serine/threonine protein kinase [Sandaracinaceae bacterium]
MSDGEDLTGQLLMGKLEVLRRLGGGGMGVVYEVEHRLTGHRRALKVVRPQFAERPRFMKRLMREAKVAGTLGSRYVVETYDAGRLEDGSAYVLMELLDGRNLYDVMQEDGTLEPRRLASIMLQVAEGIGAAHAAGIIHRDLKPENIFLTVEDGEERVKILDFGVSKFDSADTVPSRLTAEGTLVGTPYYMSPEQAGGREVDARSDVYALGVMMYEALTGRLPYEGATVGELFVKIGAGQCVPLDVRRPELEPPWTRIVHKAFHCDPEQRYPSVEALRRELIPLSSNVAATRAKTISDGVRATPGLMDSPLPPPPRVPTIGAPSSQPELHASPSPERGPDEDGRPTDGPPGLEPAPRAPESRWLLWATMGISAAAIAIVLVWRAPWTESWAEPEVEATAEGPTPLEVSTEDAPSAEGDEETSTGADTPDETSALAPPPAAEPDAAVVTERRGGGRSRGRASAAGLDPNPYR